MKTLMIHKIFGGLPKDIYAQWYIGPGRAEDLLEYGLETLTAFVDPLYRENFEGTPSEAWFWDRIREIEQTLRTIIPTWIDEEEGPTDEEGTPLYRTGRGAKARYQAYIVTWIEGLLNALKKVVPIESVPVEISPVETIPVPHAPPPLIPAVQPTGFFGRARELASRYPMVIPVLQQAFIEDAEQYVADYGIEYALQSLRSQLESIKQAGARKYGAASITGMFGLARCR